LYVRGAEHRGVGLVRRFHGDFTTIAAQWLQKLPASNKFTYNCDGHTFSYLIEKGFSE
jgi:vesicle-associated membrane protein 72